MIQSPDKRLRVELLQFHSGQKKIYQSPAKRKVIRAGRRFGKTTMLEQIAANAAAQGRRVGWFAPSYKILLPAFKEIKELLTPIIKSANKTDALIETLTQGQVEFWTTDNQDCGRSRKYHLAILDEASLGRGLKDIWEQSVEPTLLDWDGDAIAAGTPKGVDDTNWFYQICTDKSLGWEEHHAPTSANPKIKPGALASIIAGRPPLVVAQEYEARFVSWAGTNFFNEEWLLDNGKPVPYPKHCDTVFGVIDTAQKGDQQHDGSAVLWCALINFPTPHIVILDWDIIQIDGYFLSRIIPQWVNRSLELSKICLARMGSTGLFIEDKATGITLLQQGKNEGWNVAPIPSDLTALSKDARAVNISSYVSRGQVKISEFAYNKVTEYKRLTKNHLLSQVLQYVVGKPNQDDDLFDTFNYACALALGNDEGF